MAAVAEIMIERVRDPLPASELERRWGRDDRDRILSLGTDLGAGTFGWQGERLVCEGRPAGVGVQLDQQYLMQLLMGYVRPADLAGMGRLQMPESMGGLMSRLFPLQQAQLWWADRF